MIDETTEQSRTGLSPLVRDESDQTLRCIYIWNDPSLQITDTGSGGSFNAILSVLGEQTPIIVGERRNWTTGYPSVQLQLRTPRIALAPSPSQHLTDIQRWTGWSDRRIGGIVGTTHPTIARLRLGGTSTGRVRNRHFRSSLEAAHGVVARVFALSGSDSDRTAWAFGNEADQTSAASLLQQFLR